MNYYDGQGIYASYAHNSAVGHISLKDIYVGEVDVGYCGIYLKNIMNLKADCLQVRDNKGTAIKLEATDVDINWGNSQFNLLRLSTSQANAIGLNITGFDVTDLMNLLTFNWIEVIGSDYANTFGIWMKWSFWNNFYALDLEDLATAIYMVDCNMDLAQNP